MSNCLLSFPDRTLSAPSLSGGSWAGLARLQDPSRASRAQSNDLSLASTQFTIDLGQAQDLRLLALLDHNASMSAQVRVRIGNDPTFAATLFDSGWQPFWFTFHPAGGLPWGHPSFWNGGSCPVEDMGDFPKVRYFVLTDAYSVAARFIRVEINDTGNPAGYFSLSRCFVAPAWQPPINMAYGAQVQWDDSATIVSTSKGGQDYFGMNPKRRICNFTLESPTPVGVSWMMEIQRKLGISQELFFVFDPDDETMLEQSRSFIATMHTLSAIDYPYFDRVTNAYSLREKL